MECARFPMCDGSDRHGGCFRLLEWRRRMETGASCSSALSRLLRLFLHHEAGERPCIAVPAFGVDDSGFGVTCSQHFDRANICVRFDKLVTERAMVLWVHPRHERVEFFELGERQIDVAVVLAQDRVGDGIQLFDSFDRNHSKSSFRLGEAAPARSRPTPGNFQSAGVITSSKTVAMPAMRPSAARSSAEAALKLLDQSDAAASLGGGGRSETRPERTPAISALSWDSMTMRPASISGREHPAIAAALSPVVTP